MNLKRHRKYWQKELVRRSVCHYLKSGRVPDLKQFAKLATALECDPAWLQYGVTNNITTQEKPVRRNKGGGGKLNRCMVIQARLDPELHAAAVIMAQRYRRTLSSFIEMLVKTEADK